MDEGLKIHIECDKRPGLLVDIMELLELNGLNLEQANIACLEHLSLEALSLEVCLELLTYFRHTYQFWTTFVLDFISLIL